MLTTRMHSPLKRSRYAISDKDQTYIVVDGKSLINFSGNDYLGMATHPKVKRAFMERVARYGVGSTSSVMISGYHEPHKALEQAFASYLKRERVLYFNSGYHANIGVISTFANRETDVFADRLVHASIIDGIRLSQAKHHRFKHNNLASLKRCLQKSQFRQRLIISESVFSMEGDVAPLAELNDLASEYNAKLIIDDAHGLGVLPAPPPAQVLVNPLGKAFGGMGAIVSASDDDIESLIQFARSYHYTTALPPAIAHAGLTALEVLAHETWRREHLQQVIRYFTGRCQALGLVLVSQDDTPIKSIFIGDDMRVVQLQQAMRERGFYVSAIRPPTVPVGQARLRISLNCMHSQTQIDDMTKWLQQL